MRMVHVIYLALVLLAMVLLKWVYDCADYGELLVFSRDSKPIVLVEKNELFDTETSVTEWEEGFWLGLVPGDDSASIYAIMGVAPLGGGLFGLALGLMFLEYRKRKKE